MILQPQPRPGDEESGPLGTRRGLVLFRFFLCRIFFSHFSPTFGRPANGYYSSITNSLIFSGKGWQKKEKFLKKEKTKRARPRRVPSGPDSSSPGRGRGRVL